MKAANRKFNGCAAICRFYQVLKRIRKRKAVCGAARGAFGPFGSENRLPLQSARIRRRKNVCHRQQPAFDPGRRCRGACKKRASGFCRSRRNAEQYSAHLKEVIAAAPHIIIDDGGDLVNLIHNSFPQLLSNVIGGCEETTTGIIRLRAMAATKSCYSR